METTAIASHHKLKGVSQSITVDDLQMEVLHEHFNDLCMLSKSQAKQLGPNLVNGINKSYDNKDENIYLPVPKEYQPCYYRYMRGLG